MYRLSACPTSAWTPQSAAGLKKVRRKTAFSSSHLLPAIRLLGMIYIHACICARCVYILLIYYMCMYLYLCIHK